MGVKGTSGPTKDWPKLEMIESSSQEPLREEHLEYIQLHIDDPVFGTNISPFESMIMKIFFSLFKVASYTQ